MVLRVLVDEHVEAFGDLDEYVRGVAPREMPALWPMEALKAQVVCARSYAAVALGRPRHGAMAHLCDKPHCQVWSQATHPRTDQAVVETAGLVLYYLPGFPPTAEARLAQTFYSARCGGHTGIWVPAAKDSIPQAVALRLPEQATPEEGSWKCAWNPRAAPWCRAVECPCASHADWAGRSRERVGHGVGLCQWGARVLAEQGMNFAEILRHYFRDVVLGPVIGDQQSEEGRGK